MKKLLLTFISAVLCLNFTICASAEGVAATAVETAVPETAVSVAEDFSGFSDAEEGGLVPTYIDDTIEPGFTLPEETTVSEWVNVPDTNAFGANEIVPVVRDENTPIAKYMTMGDLYQAWYTSGEYEYNYPDYVCGVWTETGDMSELVVAVTKDEAGEKGKEEILSLIENDNSVKFTYQSYSYKELRQVQEEISPLMGDSSGIFGLGVSEMENKVHADIDMSNPNAEDYMKKLLAAYGDMLVFESGNGIIFDCATEGIIDSAGGMEGSADIVEIGGYDIGGGYQNTPAVTMEETAVITIGAMDTEQDNTWIFAVCVIAVLILGGVIAFAISRARVKQTNIGTVTDVEGRFTVKDTEKLVAQSGETPSRDVLSAVMSEIEK